MSKVIKIFLKRGFTPVDKSAFKIGTKIGFDCYIQRFNGYVIIIEAGTLLDEKIYKRITKEKLQIFIKNVDYQDYKEYVQENRHRINFEKSTLVLENEIKKSLEIYKVLSQDTLSNIKIKHIYDQGKNLINAWLGEKRGKRLPVDAFDCLAENIVMIIYENKITLSSLNEFLDGHYTLATHLLNVALFTALLANQLDLDLDDKQKVVLSALLHDIGKAEVDENLLEKPDLLSQKEFDIVKTHSLESVMLVKKAGLKDRLIIEGIKHHHEKLDGSGYPEGLSEKRISQFGQILAVCDVFDALVTIKPYRGAYSTYNALMLIRKEYNKKLNMKFVNIFIKLLS